MRLRLDMAEGTTGLGPAAPEGWVPLSRSSDGWRVAPFQGTNEEWDAALSTFDGSTFAHLSGWGRVITGALGHDFDSWVVLDGSGNVEGMMPMAHVRSRLFGDYLLSMPFVSYGGPLGSARAQELLIDHAVREARGRRVDLMEIRSREVLPVELDISDRKVTVLKDLPSSSEELWETGLRAKLRSQIRRPMKEGMRARFGLERMSAFYDVFARTMRDLGTPVLSRRFFSALREVFAEQLVIGVVELDGRPVAAGCGFSWGAEVEITWAGASREFNRMAPNMLLYWSFMEESIRLGAKAFNFGRCSPDSPTHRFKRQWKGHDHPLPWVQWSPNETRSTPSPESSKFRLARAVWSRLPLGVANRVGPVLSRSLP